MKNRLRRSARRALLAGLVPLAWANQALAQAQTIVGDSFKLVYNASGMDRFGAPVVVGNNIIFTPTNFSAESLNGAGVVTTQSTIDFQLYALPSTTLNIAALSLAERGDYLLSGASSSVDVHGQVRAFGLANPADEITSSLTTTQPLTIDNGSNNNWAASASANFAAQPGYVDQSAGVNVTIENLLGAYTSKTDSGPLEAYVEKKFAGGAIVLSVELVPEPRSAGLALCGFVFLAVLGVRRSGRSRAGGVLGA